MEVKATKKVSLRVNYGGELVWVDIAHMNPEIFEAFLEATNSHRRKMVKWITKWTEEDFNWRIDFTEHSHIHLLEQLVDDKYKQVYPHLYYNNVVRPNGWMRCWLSSKMAKEIRRYDRPLYNKLFRSTTNYGSRF